MKIKLVSKNSKKYSQVMKFKNAEWNKFNKENNFRYIEKTYKMFAEEKGEILGFANYKIAGGVCYLSELLIKKNTRGKGIGKSILEMVEKDSKKRGCHFIFLETSEVHKSAVPFYEKMGYKKLVDLPNYRFNFNWYIYGKELDK